MAAARMKRTAPWFEANVKRRPPVAKGEPVLDPSQRA